jgi:hypothetical protein
LPFHQYIVDIPRFLIHQFDECTPVEQAYIHRNQTGFLWQSENIPAGGMAVGWNAIITEQQGRIPIRTTGRDTGPGFF